MTRPELWSLVQRQGLEAALAEVNLAEVPEDLREAWHAAVRTLDAFRGRASQLKGLLRKEQ